MPSPEASNDDVRGVVVWRWARRPGADDPHWQFAMKASPDDHVRSDAASGQWHPMDDKAQAARRVEACKVLGAYLDDDDAVDATFAVLRVLGLST